MLLSMLTKFWSVGTPVLKRAVIRALLCLSPAKKKEQLLVVLPLSKAVISVLILYYAVFHWNDYFNALIYNNKEANAPLQIVLREILLLNQAFQNGNGGVQGGYGQSSADQVKYAIIIVSTLPILCVYPFFQKYFEKGVMIGAVKG